MREKVQEQEARRRLMELKFLVVKDGRQGRPDQLVSWGRRHAWVEWKTSRGTLTPAQARVIPKMEAAGETVLFAVTADWAVQRLSQERSRK